MALSTRLSTLKARGKMAGQICKCFNKNLFKFLTKRVYNASITVDRHIYGNRFLMIDGYLENRENESIKKRGNKAQFLERMSKYSKESSSGSIFAEDLKHMVHLVDNNEQELNLMVAMMKKFSRQNLRFVNESFVFGPIVMRCLHYFQAADLAYSLITDKSFDGYFDRIFCYIIAMDLLWKKEQYEKVLEVFEILKKRQINRVKFPNNAVVLYLAACYKLNTAESLNRARILIEGVLEVEKTIGMKTALFAVLLAINQNAPEVAMKLLLLIKQPDQFPCNDLKVTILAKLDRITECLEILKICLDRDSPQSSDVPQAEICEETLKILRSEIARLGNDENYLATLDQLEKGLIGKNLLWKKSIDDFICAPIEKNPRDRASDYVNESKSYGRAGRRQGLYELE